MSSWVDCVLRRTIDVHPWMTHDLKKFLSSSRARWSCSPDPDLFCNFPFFSVLRNCTQVLSFPSVWEMFGTLASPSSLSFVVYFSILFLTFLFQDIECLRILLLSALVHYDFILKFNSQDGITSFML